MMPLSCSLKDMTVKTSTSIGSAPLAPLGNGLLNGHTYIFINYDEGANFSNFSNMQACLATWVRYQRFENFYYNF